MDKKSLIIIAIIIAVIGAGIAYVFVNKPVNHQTTPAVETSVQSQPTTDPTPATPSNVVQAGMYIDYSAEALNESQGTKLLFFHASWCPQCRAIEASINAGTIPAGVTIFKVDYDSHQALRQKYGVTLQTTFVKVNDAGEKVDSYVAYDEPTFDAVKRELLP